MTSIAYSAINIQTSKQSVPTPPCWFGELTLMVHHLHRQGVLAQICDQVRFARRRFGQYDVIDFVAVQIALRHQWRAHTGRVLRADCSLGQSVHGPFRARSVARAFNAQSFSRCSRSGGRGGVAHPFPQGSAGSTSGQRGTSGGLIRPRGEPLP